MRRVVRLGAVVAMIGFATVGVSALADEQLTPLAASGDWVTVAHRASVVDKPDVCVAASVGRKSTLALRADSNDVEVRVADKSWSLQPIFQAVSR
jgi:hypothetical protein